jgi:hypothetical protein
MRNIILIIVSLALAASAFSSTDSIIGRPMRLSISAYGLGGLNAEFPFDPAIGAIFSLPIKYPFLHIDVMGRISGRYLFSKNYQKDEISTETNVPQTATYFHTTYSDRYGVSVIFDICPTIYLKKLFFGFGGGMTLSYDQGKYKRDEIALISQDTIHSYSSTGGGINFKQNTPAVFLFGINLGNFSFTFLAENSKYPMAGIVASYTVKEWPNIIGTRN